MSDEDEDKDMVVVGVDDPREVGREGDSDHDISSSESEMYSLLLLEWRK